MRAEKLTIKGEEEKHGFDSRVAVTRPGERKPCPDQQLADFYFGPTRSINPDKGDVPMLDVGRREGNVSGIERMASSQRLLDCLALYLLNRDPCDAHANPKYAHDACEHLQGLGRRGDSGINARSSAGQTLLDIVCEFHSKGAPWSWDNLPSALIAKGAKKSSELREEHRLLVATLIAEHGIMRCPPKANKKETAEGLPRSASCPELRAKAATMG